MSFEIKEYNALSNELVEILLDLDAKVFPEPLEKEKLERELKTKHNISIFVVYDDKTPIAFKLGFERSQRIYYSWIGGVVSEYRGKGIATCLMDRQHTYARNLGYKVVSTQTDNSFKPMVVLNLKTGFDIKGVLHGTGDDHLTIIMEKDLS